MRHFLFFLTLSLLFFGTVQSQNKIDLSNSAKKEMNNGNYVKAIELYTQVLEIEPSVYEYVWRGMCYGYINEYQKAIDDFLRAETFCATDNKRLIALYEQIGINYRKMGDYNKSIEFYNKWLNLGIDKDDALLGRALSYAKLRNYVNAIDDVTIATIYAKDSTKIAALYSQSVDFKKNATFYTDPLSDCNEAIKYNPIVNNYFQRAYLYTFYLNKTTEARADFQKVLNMDNDNGAISAYARYFLGDKEGGIELMKSFISSKENLKNYYFYMAGLQSVLGNEQEAINNLDLALQKGFDEYTLLKTDEIFINIKYKPSFKALLTKYRIPYIFDMENVYQVIRTEVMIELAKWQEKDEFETNQQYGERMNNRDTKVAELTDKIFNNYLKIQINENKNKTFSVGKYDAENQIFEFTFNNSRDVAQVYVPIAEAPLFKENKNKLIVIKKNYIIQDKNWVLSYFEVQNPANAKNYKFDITSLTNLIPIPKFALSADDVRIDIPNQNIAIPQKVKLKVPEITDNNINTTQQSNSSQNKTTTTNAVSNADPVIFYDNFRNSPNGWYGQISSIETIGCNYLGSSNSGLHMAYEPAGPISRNVSGFISEETYTVTFEVKNLDIRDKNRVFFYIDGIKYKALDSNGTVNVTFKAKNNMHEFEFDWDLHTIIWAPIHVSNFMIRRLYN